MDYDNLADKMIARANEDSLPESHEMRVCAARFKELFEGDTLPPIHTVLGVWAAARRIWCNYTGEALV